VAMPREALRRPRAIAIGALCATRIFKVDTITPPPAKLLASAMTSVIDGMALSAACAFARLGGHAGIWARLGDDAQGAAARDALAREGLDVSGLHVLPGSASSQAAVIVDARGERLVVPYHDTALDPSPAWLPVDQLHGVDMLLVDVRWPEGAAAAMRAARERGVRVMVDGEVAPRPVLQALVPLSTHAVFSDAGLAAYTGVSGVHELHDDGALEAALRRVLHDHPQLHHVGATCGAAGYAWLDTIGTIDTLSKLDDDRTLELRRMAAPQVHVVDTLAAGDVFHGAFALALVEGMPLDAAARFACHAASLKCTRFGGRLGCPTRAEVQTSIDAETPR
jgi:sulfofructose kinase